jgi:cytidyltransferase-like protein
MLHNQQIVKEAKAEIKSSEIAIYWGTFDPPTRAHFEIIKSALEKSRFEKVIVGINDNKATGKNYQISGETRLSMFQILKRDLPFKDQKRLEVKIQKNNELDYRTIKKIYPGKRVAAIVGQDSFEKFGTGCSQCDEVLVVPRSGIPHQQISELQQKINNFGLNNTSILLIKNQNQYLSISSSNIRKALFPIDIKKTIQTLDLSTNPESIENQSMQILASSIDPNIFGFIYTHGYYQNQHHISTVAEVQKEASVGKRLIR